MTCGAALIVGSVVPLAVALAPRTYAFNPNIEALVRGWGKAESDTVYEATTESIVRALFFNSQNLRFKALFVRVGVGVPGYRTHHRDSWHAVRC